MKKLYLTLLLTWLTLLSGCMGSSGKNDNIDGQTQIATALNIVTLTSAGQSQQSFDKYETITLRATLLDDANNPIHGIRINFTIDLGSLSVESALTNADGIAEVKITNPEEDLSAGTASADTSSLNKTTDYEYINNSPVNDFPTISTQLLLNGVVTNRFRADEQVQVVSTFTNIGDKSVADKIININADVGELSAVTALTTNKGVASVILLGSVLTPNTDVIGAGVLTISLADDSAVNTRINYEIVPADAIIDESIRLGYFDDNNSFVEGKIKLSITNNTLSAGGTLGLTVDLVDSENNRINTPTTITFTSNCVSNGNALIDESVLSIKGRARATFEDINCAGITGTEDIITASVTTSGVTNTSSETITITGEQLGSIEFVSAVPNAIVLTGSGGQETSILTFVVKSALGNLVAQQEVLFNLDTHVGGISLGRVSGLTNSQGLITTQVSSGTIPTVVRVSAIATMDFNGETVSVQTQSNELTVNTGLPEQASMTIGATILNPEENYGTESIIRAWLSDSFNNPVPDGTTINFTTEGGTVESSCNTVDGNCSVKWTSTEPFPKDHRSTILATASGHETFFDSNGNNIFDNTDGSAIINAGVSSGFSRQIPLASGFVDMSEAWRDDNENNTKDSDETKFFDDNGDGILSPPNGKFNGPQCTGILCDDNVKKTTLRKAMVLIMSSASFPNFVLSNSSETITYEDNNGNSTAIPDISDGKTLSLIFKFADSAMQTLPFGSQILIEIEGAQLSGVISYDVGNTVSKGYKRMKFNVLNTLGGNPEEALLTISIKTPKTQSTAYIIRPINLK
ncbi:MAG: hypothetical protein ACI9LM_000661 [Alteromonadaceae bacterium]|jgi:hypothetical protein